MIKVHEKIAKIPIFYHKRTFYLKKPLNSASIVFLSDFSLKFPRAVFFEQGVGNFITLR